MSEHRRPTRLRRRESGSAPLSQASLRGIALRPMLGTGIAATAAWAANQAAQIPLSVAAPSAAAAWLGLTLYGVRRADAALRYVDGHLENLVSGVDDLRTAIKEAVERVEGGVGAGAAAAPEFTGSLSADPVYAAEQLLFLARAEVDQAIVRAAQLQQQNAVGERAQTDLLRTIAQRQNALVSRTVEALDKAENSIEDPDTLNSLFRIDNLVTQLRRSTDNIAILGGQGLAGRTREPLPVITAMRHALEEIEFYDRVRIVGRPSDKLAFPGHLGLSIVHLLAELLENATRFSDSRTEVHLSGTEQQGGLVIAVRDRGLSMGPPQLQQLNQQLAAPHLVDVHAYLRAGRIGLVVTGQLAQRCGINVQLQANNDGPGVSAFAFIPNTALMTAPLPVHQHETAPAEASTPQHLRPGLEVHQSRAGAAHPVVAAHPLAMEADERRHAAEAPTAGRAPLPRRPDTASPRDARSAPAPVATRGPTPGLFANFRAGAQQAAPRTFPGE
ncbi:hypothetical protein [Streptomyces uncialis]|uniref:hypothetical protein n=1 Tax=Streptomyces uncialis TaxID=1048205 RepID=UPI00379FE435